MNPNQINTSRSKQIAKIIKKRQPLGNRIKRVEANLESLELALFDLEKQCNQLFTRGIDAADARRLGEIDFTGLLGKISVQLQVLEKLNTRFSRKTLNIGVVGRARQGKSRLLRSCVIADCANEVEANTKVLDPVLDYLVGNITVLDEQYARSCQKRLEQLHGEVRVELDKAQKALAQYGDEDSLFGRLLKQFWGELTSSLEDLRRHLKEQINAEDPDLKAKVGEALQNCRQNTGIPSLEHIEQKYKHFGSYDMAYYQYLHELRTHLSKHFLLLGYGLKKSIERIKFEIIGVLAKQGLLEGLTESRGDEFLNTIVN